MNSADEGALCSTRNPLIAAFFPIAYFNETEQADILAARKEFAALLGSEDGMSDDSQSSELGFTPSCCREELTDRSLLLLQRSTTLQP